MAKGSKPKTTEKKPAKEKGPKAAKKTKAPAPRFNSGGEDDEARALFLHHLPKIAEAKDKVAKATADLRNAYKRAKGDNFVKADFDVAFEIQGAEGEKAKKAAIARELTIAKWLGCDLGAQLDLFMMESAVPAEDRAFEEGKTDAMQNKAARPSYDPSVPQYKRYMEGFHSVSEARINGGIKPLDKDVETKAEVETQRARDAKAFDPPASGVAMTRAEFKKQQEAKQGVAGDTAH